MSTSTDIAITATTSVLTVVCLIGNFLVCAVVKRNHDMRVPINFLLVNMAVADIFYAANHIGGMIFRHISKPEVMPENVFCFLSQAHLQWIGTTCSTLTLILIAVERYFAVVHPYEFDTKLTIRKVKVLIPWCWITSLAINIPHFFVVHLWYFDANHPLHCKSHEKLVDHLPVSLRLALGAGSSILMAALYSRVVYALWFSRSSNNEIPPQQQVVLKVRKRITLMVISVTVIFGICWNAGATLHLATSYSSFSTSGLTLRIAHIMLMFNAAVNIFAYVLISQRFRVKIKKMLCPGEDSERVRHPAREPPGMEMVAVVPIYQTTENEVRVED